VPKQPAMGVRCVNDIEVAPDKFTIRLRRYRKWTGEWHSEVMLVPAVWEGHGTEDQSS